MAHHADLVSQTLWARGIKRAADVLLAATIGIATSPVLLLAAILIKLTSPGPLWFRQPRAGQDGRVFTLTKLRTMCADRTPDARELVPLSHPEITGVGWFLRRFKIDELPQLWSVIVGDMSIIGPRPTLVEQVERYDDFRRQRLLLRPGITGLAQVYGNTTVSWDERILYDVAYVRRCSAALDLWVLLRTARVIFWGEARSALPFFDSSFARTVTPPPDYPIQSGSIPDTETAT